MKLSLILLVLGTIVLIGGHRNPLWVLIGGLILLGAWIRGEVAG